ncbi:unnamed protein product [Brassicogethes aeneus]|uniref:Uncharacterized protein n=1 Tax=Brassicogethes aeneus TaxID=1431903 RepID=A0A9P0FQN7_BRAAE|nr:unnamed protein product [Brassicogethes aeneus]
MSSKCKGMQALILEENPLSVFVPCCGHSLNLVGKAAANACTSAVQFFDFVHNLYTFFTQKEIVRIEATHLLEKRSCLETALFAIVWNEILEPFYATNKILQDPKMTLEPAMRTLKSLKLFVESKRDEFDRYEEAAKGISSTDQYVQSRSRTRNVRLDPVDYMKAQDANLSPKDKFKVSGFIPVIDQLCVSLTERLHAYDDVRLKFGFLNHLEEMDAANLYAAADELVGKSLQRRFET